MVKVTDNTPFIINTTRQKASIFLRVAADVFIAVSDPKTPKKLGNLRRDVIRQVLGLSGKVQWQKNYAAIQESKQFKNYTTAGTGPHFAENAAKSLPMQTISIAQKAGLI